MVTPISAEVRYPVVFRTQTSGPAAGVVLIGEQALRLTGSGDAGTIELALIATKESKGNQINLDIAVFVTADQLGRRSKSRIRPTFLGPFWGASAQALLVSVLVRTCLLASYGCGGRRLSG